MELLLEAEIELAWWSNGTNKVNVANATKY